MLINAPTRDEIPDDLSYLYDRADDRVGVTDYVTALANAPEILRWYYDTFDDKFMHGGRVDVRIKELVRLRLSMTHGCAFCNKWNAVDALSAGITQAQIDALGPWPDEIDRDVFASDEVAAMRYADQIVLPNMHGYMDEELYAELKAHFDDAEIVELGVVMAVLTGFTKWMLVCDMVPKEDNCPINPVVA